jgi:hypothetical protein
MSPHAAETVTDEAQIPISAGISSTSAQLDLSQSGSDLDDVFQSESEFSFARWTVSESSSNLRPRLDAISIPDDELDSFFLDEEAENVLTTTQGPFQAFSV